MSEKSNLWIMRDAGLKSETHQYKNLEEETFNLIRKALNLLESLAFSHSKRICRELGLWPGPVPGSQPVGQLSHFSLAAQLCQNTLWGHTPATAASVIPKVGGYMRNITQPWAVLWFAPKILQGHYTSFPPQIHLLSASKAIVSLLEPARFTLEENNDRWHDLEKIPLSQTQEDQCVEGILSAGTRMDPRSTQLLWKYLHSNTNKKPQRTSQRAK